MVAFSSAAFFSSMTASGRPLTKSTMSGRRACSSSTTVNWFTASQSLLAGSSKSITRACAPRMVPPAVAVLHRHAIHQHAVKGTVAHIEVGALGTGELAEGVLQGLGGQVGFSLASASCRRCSSTTSP